MADVDQQRQHYVRRVRDLDWTMHAVRADLELAIYRAHRHGASVKDLASLIGAEPEGIRETLAQLDREEDIDEWDDRMRWVQM